MSLLFSHFMALRTVSFNFLFSLGFYCICLSVGLSVTVYRVLPV